MTIYVKYFNLKFLITHLKIEFIVKNPRDTQINILIFKFSKIKIV